MKDGVTIAQASAEMQAVFGGSLGISLGQGGPLIGRTHGMPLRLQSSAGR
jgi:hypothetical protein